MGNSDSKNTLVNEFLRFASTIKTEVRDLQFSARQIELAIYYIESAMLTIPTPLDDNDQLKTSLVKAALQRDIKAFMASALQLKIDVNEVVGSLSETGRKALAELDTYLSQECADGALALEARLVIANSLAEVKEIGIRLP